MQNHKCNKVKNAFPNFKVSRLVRVHTDSHHIGHNKINVKNFSVYNTV